MTPDPERHDWIAELNSQNATLRARVGELEAQLEAGAGHVHALVDITHIELMDGSAVTLRLDALEWADSLTPGPALTSTKGG